MNDKKNFVSTRFHSWAEQDFSSSLDLNDLLIAHPAATFFMRVKGDHSSVAGIGAGDILVIDRALSLSNHRIIVARLDGQLVIRKVMVTQNALILIDEHTQQSITITADRDFEVWGVVTYSIRQA